MVRLHSNGWSLKKTMAELNPSPTVEVLYTSKTPIAEGPFFESETNQLIWVDFFAQTINFLNLETKENKSVKLPGTVGAAIPVEGSDKLIAYVGRRVCIVDREKGAILEEVGVVDEDKPDNLLNDGKCDPEGRLWGGTMGPVTVQTPQGSFYCLDSGQITKIVSDISMSNGIDWSPDRKTLYYVDTFPNKVYAFDYNQQDGSVTNQRVVLDKIQWPDGMCIDTEGRLWIASFKCGRVTCWNPSTGEHVIDIEIPGVENVTSCCFGGPTYEWLFVTTASFRTNQDEEKRKRYPNAGDLFVVKDTGARGFPGNKYKHRASL